MRLAVMQPYFFPYLGYFQLINTVDKFIIHDDVQYIKGGWINRNRILSDNRPLNIVLPVRNDSVGKKINERYIVGDSLKFKIKILRQIENAYKKAPFFENVYQLISGLLLFEEVNVSEFNTWILMKLCNFLEISTPFYLSSEIEKQNNLTGEERVININKTMGSAVYINPSGGVELYNRDSFLINGIELKFLRTVDYTYRQINEKFVPDLSIIDLLMFNSVRSIKELLNKYILE